MVDQYTQALFDLKGEVGELRGEMTGIGREIGDIKRLLENNAMSCSKCRDGIDQALDAQATVMNNRLDGQDKKIAPIESLHEGEKAVVRWWDNAITRYAMVIGVVLGVLAFVLDLMPKGGS
jgi:hypothetical protein